MLTERPLRVSVAILTWNRCHHVVKAIQSAYDQTYPPSEIILADSASTDDTVETVRRQFPDVIIIRLHRNLGCPEGRNIALANCCGDVIYALDDDGWLPKDTIETCVDRFLSDERIGVIANRILPPDEPPGAPGDDRLHYTFSGGASAIRRSVLLDCGYYPSDFFRQAEEVDLSLRVIDQGYKILVCPAAIMYHERSPINRNDKLFHFYNTRNELYIVFRRYPVQYLIPFLVQKIISWNWLGLRSGAIIHTLSGTLAAFLSFPRLMRERKTVSASTIKAIIEFKTKARRGKVTI